jgi:hypothetical protein
MTDLTDFARRAVACKGWRWKPGMRWRFDAPLHKNIWSRYIGPDANDDDGQSYCEAIPTRRGPAVIDLSDPATLGCLLQLVREAWGDDRAYLCDFEGYDSVEWGVVSKVWDEKRNEDGKKAWFSCLLGDGPTEAEALVYALEAAP